MDWPLAQPGDLSIKRKTELMDKVMVETTIEFKVFRLVAPALANRLNMMNSQPSISRASLTCGILEGAPTLVAGINRMLLLGRQGTAFLVMVMVIVLFLVIAMLLFLFLVLFLLIV